MLTATINWYRAIIQQPDAALTKSLETKITTPLLSMYFCMHSPNAHIKTNRPLKGVKWIDTFSRERGEKKG